MKSMVGLLLALLNELGQNLGINTSRDAEFIRSRVESEGESFLTITLPEMDKLLTKWLDQGFVMSADVVPLRMEWCGFGVDRPKFLGEFYDNIFDSKGIILDRNNERNTVSSVRALRQVYLLCSKVELKCAPKRVAAAYQQYVDTDKGIPEIDGELLTQFAKMADRLFGRLFNDVEALYYETLPLAHSGGALATRESSNGRYDSRTWTEYLDGVLPHWDSVSVNWRDAIENPPKILPPSAVPSCRVTEVPKTMKGPRIIAMEPVWNNKVQQGLLKTICKVLERKRYSKLASAFYWDTQLINQELARQGSKDGSLATLDLSEASDRVSFSLVRDGLLANSGYLQRLSIACRSRTAVLPSGETLFLRKFASMGSALTFPYETMVFYTIINLVWHDAHGSIPKTPLGPSDGIRVFGDDIVVPVWMVPGLIDKLEAFGLKVNRHKSFWGENFRESCGGDFFRGWAVKPVRMRKPLPDKPDSFELIESGVALHNRLYVDGLYASAEYVRRHLALYSKVPMYYVPVGSELRGFYSFDEEKLKIRHNSQLQRLEVKTLNFVIKAPLDPLDGYGALFKCLTTPSKDRDEDHLLRAGRGRYVKMNSGWQPLE